MLAAAYCFLSGLLPTGDQGIGKSILVARVIQIITRCHILEITSKLHEFPNESHIGNDISKSSLANVCPLCVLWGFDTI